MSGRSLSTYAPGDASLRCHHARARTRLPGMRPARRRSPIGLPLTLQPHESGTASGRGIHSTAPADGLDYSFWTGAAGILWALARLGHGVDEDGLLAGYQSQAGAGESPGLMHGEVGVLLVSWKLEPTPEKEERLLSSSRRSPQPVARAVQRLPGDDAGCPTPLRADGRRPLARGLARMRRRAAGAVPYRPGVRLPHLDPVPPRAADPEHRCRARLRLERPLAAPRGSVARRGAARRDPAAAMRDRRHARAARRRRLVNWPTAADPFWAEEFPIRVQWCHGAPGLVTSLADPPARRRGGRAPRRGG